MGSTVPGFPTIYDPAHVCQFDGGPYQAWDCGPTSMAMLADDATLGAKTYTGEQVRQASGRLTQSGTNLGDLAKAWKALTLPGALDTSGGSESQMQATINGGKEGANPDHPQGVILGGSYGSVPVRFRSQADFTGPHEIYVGYYDAVGAAPIPRDPYQAQDTGPRYWIHDPIARSSGAWWPASVVHAFGWTAGWGGSWGTAAQVVDTSNYITWAGLDKYADQPLTAADIDKITAWASSQGLAGVLSGPAIHQALDPLIGHALNSPEVGAAIALVAGQPVPGFVGTGSPLGDLVTAFSNLPLAIGEVGGQLLLLAAFLALTGVGLYLTVRSNG